MTGRRISSTQHGEYGYARKNKCQCDPCLHVQRRYCKELSFDNYNNRPRQLDAQPARDHVFELVRMGATLTAIAKAAGVYRTQIKRLLYGNPTTGKEVSKLHRHTAEALLALTPNDVFFHGTWVHPIGTIRRVEALGAMGHNKETIAAEIGIQWSNIYEYTYQERMWSHTADRVKEAYDRLCMRPGTSEILKWKARRLGWLPPLAWDDDTIDDPMAEPDLSAIKCVVETCSRPILKGMLCGAHHRRVAERGGFESAKRFRDAVMLLAKGEVHDREAFLEDLRECQELGMNPEEAARRLGRKLSYVSKWWKAAA